MLNIFNMLIWKGKENMKKSTGVSMAGTKSWQKERVKRGIKSIECNCKKCLYYTSNARGNKCKFGKYRSNRTKCIQYTQY